MYYAVSSSKMSALNVMFIAVVVLQYASAANADKFAFQVFQVKNCPMSKVDWDSASKRLKCNTTHGYHCVPDKYFTSLIEFCYPHGYRLPFEKGNCLELAADGILNHFPCQNTFSSGCPIHFYFSNEIYKYPKCLSINSKLRCFDADVPCILEKSYENSSSNQGTTCSSLLHLTPSFSEITRHNKGIDVEVFAVIIASLFVIILGILVAACVIFRRKLKLGVTESVPSTFKDETHERDKLLDSGRQIGNHDQDCFNLEEVCKKDPDFVSLIEACRKGDLNRYHKLTTPLEFNKNLLKMKDNIGWTVFFYAVYGGSHDIVHSLLGHKETDLSKRDNIGRTVLHLAAKKGNVETFDAILQKASEIDLMDKDKNGLMPFCYAALAGQKSILEHIRSRGFDITKVTKYGESIAHLACIGESLDILKMAAEIDEQHTKEPMNNEQEEEIIKRKNKMDWNALQYAAKSGNTEILKFLDERHVLVRNPTKDMKSALHSACENGRLEVCKYIAQHHPEIMRAEDTTARHAGHFVAKCGDVELLKYLIEDCKLQANTSSSENINILHVACCHGRLDICKYIADKYPDLVKQESNKGWNAALFIGEKGGADEDRIEILKYLVKKHKLFVYHVSRAGKTILYNACANRSYLLCEHLLENYPNLLTVERSMDPRNAARDSRITTLIQRYTTNV